MGKYWNHTEETRKIISESAKKRYLGRIKKVNCKLCNKVFSVPISRLKDGRGKYCSKKCQYKDKKGIRCSIKSEFKKGEKPKNYLGNTVVCKYCGKRFESSPSSNRIYCSKKCLIDSCHILIKCLVCKKVFEVIKCKKTSGRKFCSRKCFFVYYCGYNHSQWKGGVTPINEKIRKSLEYKQWRNAVYKRDNYTCKICGAKNTYLNADHIKQFAIYPELRFDVNNGRTLCVTCHRKTNTWGGVRIKNLKTNE